MQMCLHATGLSERMASFQAMCSTVVPSTPADLQLVGLSSPGDQNRYPGRDESREGRKREGMKREERMMP